MRAIRHDSTSLFFYAIACFPFPEIPEERKRQNARGSCLSPSSSRKSAAKVAPGSVIFPVTVLVWSPLRKRGEGDAAQRRGNRGILAAAGRARRVSDADGGQDSPFRRADIELLFAEGLMRLEERGNAEVWLERAHADISAYDLTHLHDRAEILAKRL